MNDIVSKHINSIVEEESEKSSSFSNHEGKLIDLSKKVVDGWPHPPGAPLFLGLGPPPFGTIPFEAPPFGAGLAKVGQLRLAEVGLAKVGQLKLAKVGQIFLGKVGLAKVGRSRRPNPPMHNEDATSSVNSSH